MKIVITSYFFIVILFATVSWSHEGSVEKAHKHVGLSRVIDVEERITEEGLSEFGVWVPIEEQLLTPQLHLVVGSCPPFTEFHGVCHTLISCEGTVIRLGLYANEC